MHLISIFVNSRKRREDQVQRFPPSFLSLRVILFPKYGGKEARYHLFQILKKNYSYILGEKQRQERKYRRLTCIIDATRTIRLPENAPPFARVLCVCRPN